MLHNGKLQPHITDAVPPTNDVITCLIQIQLPSRCRKHVSLKGWNKLIILHGLSAQRGIICIHVGEPSRHQAIFKIISLELN